MRTQHLLVAGVRCCLLTTTCGCTADEGGATDSLPSVQQEQPSPDTAEQSPITQDAGTGLPGFMEFPSGEILCSARVEFDYNGSAATKWVVIFAPDQSLDSVYSFYDSICSQESWEHSEFWDIPDAPGMRKYVFNSWDPYGSVTVRHEDNSLVAVIYPPGMAAQQAWEALMIGPVDEVSQYSPEFAAALAPNGPVASTQGVVISLQATQYP